MKQTHIIRSAMISLFVFSVAVPGLSLAEDIPTSSIAAKAELIFSDDFERTDVGYLRSSGIAHETKSSFHFTITGPGVLFDDVHIWKAVPTTK